MARPSNSGLPFLVLRSDAGTFTYWRVLPHDIVPHFIGNIDLPWRRQGQALAFPKVVKISLTTGDEKIARERWGIVHAQIEELLRAAFDKIRQKSKDEAAVEHLKKVHTLTPEQIATIAHQARHDVREEDSKVWEDGNHLSPKASIIHDILLRSRLKDTGELRDRARQMAADSDLRLAKLSIKDRVAGLLDQDIVLTRVDKSSATGQKIGIGPETIFVKSELTQRLEENGLELPNGSPDRLGLSRAVLYAKIGGAHDLVRLRCAEHVETGPRPALLVEQRPNGVVECTKTLSQMHEVWVALERPGRKAIDDSKLYVDRFIGLHGDLDLREITRTHVRVFRDTMGKFPRNIPRHLDAASPEKIIAWRDANPSVPLLSRQTVNEKAIATLSKLFNKAIAEGYAEANPCTHVKFSLKESDKTIRVSFDQQDLGRLLASPIYADRTYRPKGGGGEAAFWLPLISLFTGARLEEIGQLHVADVADFDGVACIDITTIETPGEDDVSDNIPATAKTLKTTSSKRRVPIHRMLIDAGFLSFVAERRRNKGRMLFPALIPYRERHTKNWSRWWGRYQNQYVNASKDRVFHSFRHSFKDAMSNARVHPDVMKAILGHANADVTDGYGIGPALQIMNEELQRVGYPGVDFANILKMVLVNYGV